MSRPVFQPNKPQTGNRWTLDAEYGDKLFPGCEYSPEQVDWLRAIIKWKAMHEWKGHFYPTDIRSVLTIAKALGYRQVANS